jgi:signal transduction histidine kinase
MSHIHAMTSETQSPPGGEAPHPPAAPPSQPTWRSLWLRVVAMLALMIGLTTAALFFGVDHFVSSRFSHLHGDRLTRLVADTRQAVDRELSAMAGIASLVVYDIDLVNSTYYHLHLDGTKEHAEEAVRRIARNFGLESVTLWDIRDQLVAAGGSVGAAVPLAFPVTDVAVRAEARWLDQGVWVVAVATLQHNEDTLARIQLARPLPMLLGPSFAPGQEVAVLLAKHGPPPPGAVRVAINPDADPPVALDLQVPDAVAAALADVKRVLAWVMAGFGVLLAVVIAVFLRRLFRPILELIQAAPAIGHGEFGRQVAEGGWREVRQLVQAFNQMSDGLQRLRVLERQVQHQEQLSAIGRVAARVAHDLNNPLTVISSVARLAARRTDIPPALAKDMQLILHHCQRSISTIQALLAYGRPIRLRCLRLDLAQTAAQIARRWAQRYPEVTLAVTLPDEPVPVSADPYQLEQMLDNLLDNARSMAPRVTLTVSQVGAAGRVGVADDGPGFSDEARRHLFEPFFTTRTGGTGLGLASCLAIARAHGGDIVVEPGPPGVVTVCLPVAEVSGA